MVLTGRLQARHAMLAQTSMLHVHGNDHLKAEAADAVRILLTRVAAEGCMPVGLTAGPEE